MSTDSLPDQPEFHLSDSPRRPYHRPLRHEEGRIADRYVAGERLDDLAAEYGVNRSTIWRILERLGAPRRMSGRVNLTVNENAFDEITEDSAYWVGFLMADGCITDYPGRRTKRLQLTLAARDAGHIQSFRDFLGSACKMRPGRSPFDTPNVSVTATSNKLVDALQEYGVRPRKSLNCKVRHLEMNRDFWRGVIDGDGHLACEGKIVLRLVGSRQLMKQFQAFARSVSADCFAAVLSYSGENVHRIHLSGRSAHSVTTALYDGCTIALPRKWEVARKIMAMPTPRRNSVFVELSIEQIAEIRRRRAAGESGVSLATEFRVSQVKISNIYRRIKSDPHGAIETP